MNTYVMVTYLAILTFAIGAGIVKLCFIFEEQGARKYYERLKNDAAFWQMKIEQSGMTIIECYESNKEQREREEWLDEKLRKEEMDELIKFRDERFEMEEQENKEAEEIREEVF